MNIVVAVDLSPASEKVVEAARGVAKLTGARIFVLHVVETEANFVGCDSEPEILRELIAKDFPREHRDVLALTQKLQDDGLDATAWLARGNALDATLKELDRLDAGLMVVGTHGRGAVFDMLIGSYSAGIIRKSKLPVLVVPVREP